MTRTKERATSALAVLSFLGVAVVQTWPLARHLSTHVTGNPGGDAGAYLWNVWHFRHRLLDLGASPFTTTHQLAAAGPVNLALHNYSVFADVLALPLLSFLGVVATFNLVYIANVALTGIGMFLLARRVTGAVVESWIAGVMFAWAPFLVARGASHFSLAAAAPLPFFLFFVDRAWHGGRLRDAAAAGATMAWAFYCDPYYAVYTAMLLIIYVAAQHVTCERAVDHQPRLALRVIDGLTALTVAASLVLVSQGRTLYTPMLIVAMLLVVRLAVRWRLRVVAAPVPPRPVRLLAAMTAAAVVLLAPELRALALMSASNQLVTAPVLWRSSAPGVDGLLFVIPNPNHVLTPAAIRAWIASQPGGYDESVASISYVAVLVIAAAWRVAGFRAAGLWLTITLGFASLAVGPFLRLAGFRTFFPTPWALGRYLPVIGEARMPQRFSILVFLGLTVLLAAALAALTRRWPPRRTLILATAGLALALELWPAPRELFAADVPGVFRTVAADPRAVRVLELPFGLRDGLSSLGDFGAGSLYYQTFHHKDLVGGYVSRIDERTKDAYRREPLTRALMDFAEGREPTADLRAAAVSSAPAFIDRLNLQYVVIDRPRVTPAHHAFAVEAFGLVRLDTPDETGTRELYRPTLGRRAP